MTSLAAQLAQNASLNSSLLVDRSRRKPRESYLFTGRDDHDLDSLHALGLNGLAQLSMLDPTFRPFEDDIFSDQARAMDRTLLSAEGNAQLDKTIGNFLSLLRPYLLESPTNKVLEWLVRRLRINEFNVEDILALFLPYHESPHFAKMLSILHIKKNTTWSFLLPFKSAAQSVPRLPLVTEMLKNTDVARFITSLLPSALKQNRVHHALIAFNAACINDFISRSKVLDEGTVAFLLPALLEPLQVDQEFVKESVLGTYFLLSRFSQKVEISVLAIKTIVGAMAGAAPYVPTRQFLTAIIAVLLPQGQQECFSGKISKQILALPDFTDELLNAAGLSGFEKFTIPLLKGLAKKIEDDTVQLLVSSLLTHSSVPDAVVKEISRLVLQHVVSSDTQQAELRSLLYTIHQRHPTMLHLAAQEMAREDEAIQPVVQQVLISLTLDAQAPPSKEGDSPKHDVVIASASADSNVRELAVKELLQTLSGPESLPSSELESMHSALIARVHDTDAPILEALYQKPDVITPLLLQNTKAYIDTLALVLCSKPKHNIIKIHLTFLAKHFNAQANKEVIGEVFHKIFFPHLLFSKPRQHTADMVWDIIKANMSDSASDTCELLHGCAAIVDEEKNRKEESIQTMSRINMDIASKIARNILASNDYNAHFRSFLPKLQAKDTHTQVLAYLVMHALIKQLSGEHQIEAAHNILDAIGSDEFASFGNLSADSENVLESFNGADLARHTVTKPNSKSTLQRLQLGIVVAISSVSAPCVPLDWIADLDVTSMNLRGRRYVELIRTVYRIANELLSLPSLTMILFRALFLNLKDDSLAFLAGIWSAADKAMKDDNQLRVVALQHASAFLQAHVDENDGVDYQTVIPLLLVALSSANVAVRQAALTCVAQLRTLSEHAFVTVYKFDAIYGGSEGKLQYLDQVDLRKYLAGLVEESDHLIHDNTFVRLFHERHLRRTKSDKRKEYEYKHRVLCYILSHVQLLSLPSAQVMLLKVIENLSDKAKARILSSIVEMFTSTNKSSRSTVPEELISLCIAAFDSSVASEFNESQSTLWAVYMAMVRQFFSSDESLRLQAVVVSTLENGLFRRLSQENKVSLCELVLDVGAQDHQMYGSCKKLLACILTDDSALIIHLLSILQPQVDASQRASKRAKTTDDPNKSVRRFTLLIEVLGTKPLLGSPDLISLLLDTISRVAQSFPSSQADVSYVEQLLMSSIDNAAEGIAGIPNLSQSTIRLDILVELIRASNNPQTFHQALLLISKLSRFAPESALHNVMPIFTFMGSNVFHRDDTYSFKVVQQTIDSIIPFMVSSLKQSHAEKLDLYIASKGFLHIFTDASNHIPRHRRNHFFFHLVDVLGPTDFLAPIVMLMVAKFSNRVIRQTPEEARATLTLPVAVLQHFSPSLQMLTLTEILNETQRLVSAVIDSNTIQSTFLGESIDDFKRHAKSLIAFVGVAIASSPSTAGHLAHVSSGELGAFVSILVALAALDVDSNASVNVEDIQQAAQTSLSSALASMPATSFVASVLTMLESQNSSVKAGGLDLLAERLPMIANNVRQEVTDTVKKIVDWVRTFLASRNDEPVAQSAFRALRSIGSSLQPGEEATINDVVPSILSAIRQQTASTPLALASLVPLPTKVGPRFIPYLRDTVTICVACIAAESKASTEDAYAVLQGLLVATPTFWGTKELTQILSLYTKHWGNSSHGPPQAMKSLINAATKRVPPKTLSFSLLEAWPSYQAAPNKGEMAAYFDVLTRTLRAADRSLLPALLRSLVKLFLEAFDIVAMEADLTIESNVILAFKQVVVKLNEAAFKPIYRKVHDWAFAGDIAETTKRATFYHLYASLLDFFKALMTPYMSFLLSPLIHDLQAFSSAVLQDKEYWSSMLTVITKSLKHDDGAYWRDDRLRQICKPLIAQVPACINLSFSEQRQVLQDCIEALVDAATDETLLKSINLDLLMHTRSEETRIRVYALTCAEVLWQRNGRKLHGFVAETATFIAECNEDDNDVVVKESLKLKNAVESVAGSINDL